MSSFADVFRTLVGRVVLANPTGIPHAQLSMIAYDDRGAPTPRLLDLAAEAVKHARTEDLSEISARMTTTPRWPDIWPGEHYKLLAGLVKAMEPLVVIEVGTYLGLGALALARRLPPGGRVYTFDIVPYARIPGHAFQPLDFETGRITQVIADLIDPVAFESHRELLESADLIFVDAPKDGVFERKLLARFETLRFQKPPIVVFDDIRVWNMLAIWREVTRPKLDLTSLGHWSGTGLIDWQPAAAGANGGAEAAR